MPPFSCLQYCKQVAIGFISAIIHMSAMIADPVGRGAWPEDMK